MFTFRVRPTFDFIQELLKYGAALEVVQPQWLRDEMRRTIKAMSERYETAD
jgi:predicted DNA-binding transcriptional regulator YafY